VGGPDPDQKQGQPQGDCPYQSPRGVQRGEAAFVPGLCSAAEHLLPGAWGVQESGVSSD
jgi:hypothetical protein